MKLKALVLVVSVSVLATLGLFAATISASSRIDGPTLREALFSRLGEWMGGEVVWRGPVSLEGVFNMRLEAENVEIKGVKRLGVTWRFKVGKLSAHLNWFDAANGQPTFSDLTLENVSAVADILPTPESGGPSLAATLGMAGLSPVFEIGRAGARKTASPFTRIQILNAQTAFTSSLSGGARRRAHPRLKIIDMQIKFGADGEQELVGTVDWRRQTFAVTAQRGAPGEKLAKAPVDLFVGGRLFTLTASGELTSGPEQEPQFKGEAALTSSDLPATTRWLKINPLNKLSFAADSLSVSGHVTWKENELSLSQLEAGLDGRSLSGAVSIKNRSSGQNNAGRLGVEGAIVLSDFDLNALTSFTLEEAAPGTPSLLGEVDADLRISVNRLSAGGVSDGGAALTLLAKDGWVSADLADMAVLGGKLRGHFALDVSHPKHRLVIRATGADLDSAQFSRAISASGWLTGGANVNVEAQAEGADWPGLFRSLNGEADVTFSEGGGVGLDLVGLAGGEGARRESRRASRLSWTGRGFMRFDTLRAELAIDHGRIRSKSFELATGRTTVAGRCLVDLQGQSIDWRFDIHRAPAAETDDASESDDAARPAEALASSVTIKGPWLNPSIRIGDPGAALGGPTGAKSHLSGQTPNG
jgi:AsmA protein